MHLRPQSKLEREPCYWFYDGPIVFVDGNVGLCGYRDFNADSELIIGNILQHSLLDLWQSKTTDKLRQQFWNGDFPGICKKCTTYANLDYYRMKRGSQRAKLISEWFESKTKGKRMGSNDFYEKYYQNAAYAILGKDPIDSKRLSLLFSTLKKIGQTKKVLDAGCGIGFFTNAIKKAGYEAVGIDISKNAIEEARKRYPDIHFICNDLTIHWPFEDSAFDVIFSTEVIEHVLGIYDMFSEMNRVLKKGGVLVLTTPYHGLIKNLLVVLFNFDRHFDVEGGHIRFFTEKFLIKILKNFGFAVIETEYIGRIRPIPKSIYIVTRKINDLK